MKKTIALQHLLILVIYIY